MILNKEQLIIELNLSNKECFDDVVRDLKVAGVVEEIKDKKEILYKYSHLKFLLFLEA